MAATKSFKQSNLITDFSSVMENIPNQWGMISQMGLFEERGITQNNFTFDEINNGLTLLLDSPRGERVDYNTKESYKTHVLPVPHFTFDDALTPKDIANIRQAGTESEKTLDQERARVLRRARRNWAATMETARMEAIKGNVYAPRGTVSINWYQEFGKTQATVAIDTATSGDISAKIEEIIATIQDNTLSGDIISDMAVIVSPTFFEKLINAADTQDAYAMYEATNQIRGEQPLRDRMGNPMDIRGRTFTHKGLTFIEYRAQFKSASPLVEADTGYAMPLNVDDMYQTIYAPAERFSSIGTLGQSQYAWETILDDVKWEYKSESNFLNMVNRPQSIVKVTIS